MVHASTVDKHCIKCDDTKPTTQFHLDKRRNDGLFPWCKDCRRAYVGATRREPRRFATKREYDIDYRARMAAAERTERGRRRYLWTKYRITPEDYDALLVQQGGACAICGDTDPTSSSKYGNRAGRFHIDHDHACCPGSGSCGNCVRGLLCFNCNSGIGMLGDDPGRLAAAIRYLADAA